MSEVRIQPSQFSVLMIVNGLGPISITKLAEKMGLERSTMSRNLKALEKDGLIKVSEEGWRRVRMVELTKSGKVKLHEAIPLWNEAQSKMSKMMGKKDWETLLHLLDRAIQETTD